MVDTFHNCLNVLETLSSLFFYATSDKLSRFWLDRQLS